MKKLVAPALGLAVLALLAAGCGKTAPNQPQESTSTPTAQDVAMVNDAVASNTPYVEENEYQSNVPSPLDTGTPGFDAAHPVFWWRTIRSVTRTFETQFSAPDSNGRPTLATVIVHKRMLGSFNVLLGDSTSFPDSLVRKPLDDHWQRRLLFHRVRVDTSSGNSIWRLAGTSGVEVTSANATVQIQSVRVQAAALDTTITDPLAMYRLRRVLFIPVSTPVTVTVTTNSPDDIVLLYRWQHRFRFHNNGDNTYTYQWTTNTDPGLRHFGVNALTHGTIFDPSAPYDSNTWLFPFVVSPMDAMLDR